MLGVARRRDAYGSEHGTYMIIPETGEDGLVRLRVGAKRGRGDHWQEVAVIVLSPEEAHDLGWHLRDVLLEQRFRAYEQSQKYEE